MASSWLCIYMSNVPDLCAFGVSSNQTKSQRRFGEVGNLTPPENLVTAARGDSVTFKGDWVSRLQWTGQLQREAEDSYTWEWQPEL